MKGNRMKKMLCILLMLIFGLVVVSISAQEEEEKKVSLDKVRQRADSVLDQTNVSARRDIDVVFELIDRLLDEKHEDAEYYIKQGLKHFPWNLKYQMIYAELLAKEGNVHPSSGHITITQQGHNSALLHASDQR